MAKEQPFHETLNSDQVHQRNARDRIRLKKWTPSDWAKALKRAEDTGNVYIELTDDHYIKIDIGGRRVMN